MRNTSPFEKHRPEPDRMTWSVRIITILVVALPLVPARAADKENSAKLTVQRIFGGHEFEPEHVSVHWIEGGRAYTTLEPSTGPSGGRDIVRHDPSDRRDRDPGARRALGSRRGRRRHSGSTIMRSRPIDRGS